LTRSHPWNELLPLAGKPQQYVGCEWNAPAPVPGRPDVTLVYPDTYELGMSNFGLSVVGHLLRRTGLYNVRRAFCPAPDMLAMLVDSSSRWVCVDDAFPVGESAVVGFGLPSEVLYSNVLRLLDLGGIPRRSCGRTDDHPVILAGGGGLSNPLPLAPYMDVFYLGEAEGRIEGLF